MRLTSRKTTSRSTKAISLIPRPSAADEKNHFESGDVARSVALHSTFPEPDLRVKYGGSFMDSPDPEERHRVARDVVFLEAVGINPVVVHGGGKAITRALEETGVKSEFVHGYRVTDAASAEIVDRVLSREINPEIAKAIQDLGGKARGLAGPEIFRCRKFSPKNDKDEDVDLGFVGEVCAVNVEPLRECIRRSVTPVISPTALGDDGKIYNCN